MADIVPHRLCLYKSHPMRLGIHQAVLIECVMFGCNVNVSHVSHNLCNRKNSQAIKTSKTSEFVDTTDWKDFERTSSDHPYRTCRLGKDSASRKDG